MGIYLQPRGELAQLVERLHGMQEATGSNPVFSTKKRSLSGERFFYLIAFRKAEPLHQIRLNEF